ncbi:methyl-accepting chemotaxis protein [Bacillus sp. FJAT-45350]|uniref:methyl-accepting chemotaxis protein n=1 Tax=Bacillus sp. FJAT-45350 TaxID=2011014 RepID=UPI0015C90716|nr:HAMP domain-containing methyl-accepting chemotaxis protein [Bacillus sp. FJAT-45350]
MNLWNNLKIRWKVLLAFFLVCIIFITGGITIYLQLDIVTDEVENLERRSDRAVIITDIGALTRSKYILVSDFVRNGTYDENFYTIQDEKLTGFLNSISTRMHTDQQQELFQSIVSGNDKFDELAIEIFNGDEEAQQTLISELDVIRHEMVLDTLELVDIVKEQAHYAADMALSSVDKAKNVFFISFVISLVVGCIIFILLSNQISRNLKKAVDVAQSVSQGNLDIEKIHTKSKDEIGELSTAMNYMLDQLRELIQHISHTSEQLAASSEQLSASSEENSKVSETISESIQVVATGTETQSHYTQEVENTAQEMATGMHQISQSMQSVNESALTTSQSAVEGKEVINQTIQQMNQINTQTRNTSEVIKQLGGKSEEIGNIISLITSIAEQTNLLALNATIEAARAGEHGKGFAVVANEVRKLAEQSTDSSGKIGRLVKDIQTDIQQSVEHMTHGRLQVEEGLNYVNQAGTSFSTISDSVRHITGQVQDVSASLQQITSGSEAMLENIRETANIAKESANHAQNVAASTEESNASMEEVTASAESLAKMAEELQETVRVFKL